MVPVAESKVVVPSDMIAIGESDHMDFMRSESYDFKDLFLRHQNQSNVVFCDGHVESPTLQFLFEDTSDDALVGTATICRTAKNYRRDPVRWSETLSSFDFASNEI